MDSNCHGRKNPHDGQEEMDLALYGDVVLALLKEDTTVTRPLHTSCFGEVHFFHTNSIWDLPEIWEEATSEMSSGSMSAASRASHEPAVGGRIGTGCGQ